MWECSSSATIGMEFENLPMINRLPWVLIIARQEQLRDSLQVLLTSLSGVGSVEVVGGLSSNLVEKDAAPAALVLLALDLSYSDSETLLPLQQIKSTWPGVKTVVLVEDERQYEFVQTIEVDVILFKGTRAALMLKHIEQLLPGADP
jgi:DNA-binding NarL/FixJ family response regulator